MAPLQQAGSEMDIEKMQHGTVGQGQIATQATAALAEAPAHVIVSAELHGKAAERHGRRACPARQYAPRRPRCLARTISSRLLGPEGNTEL